MRHTAAISCLVASCSLALVAAGQAVKKADLDSNGWLHIISADGHDYTIRPSKWQSGGGFGDVQIAADGATVGWLADAMLSPFEGNTNYSYAVALELDIWRGGRVIQRFKAPSFSIRDWLFLDNGTEVAFHIAPAHGQEFYECTLLDVSTGRKLAHWELDRKDYVIPDWAKQLLVDDPLPKPDDISRYWFPAAPSSSVKVPQPKQK